MREIVLAEIMMRRGANKAIAEGCGLSTSAVSQWKRVPKKHLETVASIVSVPASVIRPDLFNEDRELAA